MTPQEFYKHAVLASINLVSTDGKDKNQIAKEVSNLALDILHTANEQWKEYASVKYGKLF